MSEWREILIPPSSTIREAIAIIDAGSMQMAVVVDDKQSLLGTVTDGDIRRGILRGRSLESPVTEVMNPKPVVAAAADDRDTILEMMRAKQIHQIPVVDAEGTVINIEVLDKLLRTTTRDNWVVLMAGGIGARLQPLTTETPKPLLKVGGSKPLLETIIGNFIECGYRNFYVSVNYKAEMVKSYFEDGSRWGAQIRYIHEMERMGTAGALALINETFDEPLVVMNGDVLTRVNFNHLLDFHRHHKATATMCVKEYEHQIQYGVAELEGHTLKGVVEKPVQKFFINAGIYVLSPEMLGLIPKQRYFDMPTLFSRAIEEGHEVAAFPIREYWLDIGLMSDFERANGDFPRFFR